MMSSDPPGIMFVEFFREKYLLAMDNDNTHPSTQGADKTPDEKLKINKLGPNAKNLIFVLQLKWKFAPILAKASLSLTTLSQFQKVQLTHYKCFSVLTSRAGSYDHKPSYSLSLPLE